MASDESPRLSVDDLLSRAVDEQVRAQDGVRSAIEELGREVAALAGRLDQVEGRLRERLELDASMREWMEREFTSFAAAVRDAMDTSANKTSVSLTEAAARTAEGMEHLAGVARDALDQMTDRVERVTAAASEASDSRLERTVVELSSRLDGVVDELRQGVGRLRDDVDVLADTLRRESAASAEDLRTRIELVSEKLRSGVESASSGLRDGVESASLGLRSGVESATSELRAVVTETLHELLSEVRRDVGRVPAALDDQRHSIASEVRAALSELWSVTAPGAQPEPARTPLDLGSFEIRPGEAGTVGDETDDPEPVGDVGPGEAAGQA